MDRLSIQGELTRLASCRLLQDRQDPVAGESEELGLGEKMADAITAFQSMLKVAFMCSLTRSTCC